jgi:hypothetical protein
MNHDLLLYSYYPEGLPHRPSPDSRFAAEHTPIQRRVRDEAELSILAALVRRHPVTPAGRSAA